MWDACAWGGGVGAPIQYGRYLETFKMLMEKGSGKVEFNITNPK
jgi:hypothetical protein